MSVGTWRRRRPLFAAKAAASAELFFHHDRNFSILLRIRSVRTRCQRVFDFSTGVGRQFGILCVALYSLNNIVQMSLAVKSRLTSRLASVGTYST